MANEVSELAKEIARATSAAYRRLFEKHPGNYYYCSLITTGEGHAPVIAAWSREALADTVAGFTDQEEAYYDLKWSYADSPFYCYGDDLFEQVREMFDQRPQMNPTLTTAEWEAEFSVRLNAMEEGMALVDREGVFGTGDERLRTAVLVEVQPPDYSNTERAIRLNPLEAIEEWLREAAEPLGNTLPT